MDNLFCGNWLLHFPVEEIRYPAVVQRRQPSIDELPFRKSFRGCE